MFKRWQSRAMPASLRKLIRCRPATPGSERACSASSHATSKHACAGVLDRAEEELRRRVDLAAREIRALRHRGTEREQLDRVEVEHAPCLRLVAGGHVVAGQAADVLDAVQRGARYLRLEREPVAV